MESAPKIGEHRILELSFQQDCLNRHDGAGMIIASSCGTEAESVRSAMMKRAILANVETVPVKSLLSGFWKSKIGK